MIIIDRIPAPALVKRAIDLGLIAFPKSPEPKPENPSVPPSATRQAHRLYMRRWRREKRRMERARNLAACSASKAA